MSAQLGTYASFDDIAKQTPLGRLGNEDDMGGAALYLSSKAGAWVTGVILNVDGGAVGGLQIKLADEDE
jgi:NAD(P)-dependent dehydrogenase (short-subunit alcohol dehydrogenase family)